MSVSFWKMSPEIVFLGGRAEAEWLTKYFATEDSSYFTKVSISTESLAEAAEKMRDIEEPTAKKEGEKILKKLTDMLKDHKRNHKSIDSGYDWFDIEISW